MKNDKSRSLLHIFPWKSITPLIIHMYECRTKSYHQRKAACILNFNGLVLWGKRHKTTSIVCFTLDLSSFLFCSEFPFCLCINICDCWLKQKRILDSQLKFLGWIWIKPKIDEFYSPKLVRWSFNWIVFIKVSPKNKKNETWKYKNGKKHINDIERNYKALKINYHNIFFSFAHFASIESIKIKWSCFCGISIKIEQNN